MDPRAPAFSQESLAAAFDWWREAGVDQDFSDDIQVWLAEEVEAAATAPAAGDMAATKPAPPPRPGEPKAPPVGGEPASWPQDLPTFREWWLAENSLDQGGTSPRLPPRGEAGAALMVLVPMPEEADSGQLLSGPAGAFLGAMLQAMGLAAEQTYIASALPRHMPHVDFAALGDAGLGGVLRHHIALAAPQRIVAFGRDLGPLLEGTESAPILQTYSLAALYQRTAFRAGFWRRWLDFSGDTQT